MRFSPLTLTVLIGLAVSGCATLTKNECQSGDWYGIGRADGANGHPAARLEEHRDACREFGINPNETAWRKGRQEGLLTYCTASNGYAQGKSGATYHYVCPSHLASGFERSYRVGRQVYEVNEKIHRIDSKIRSKEKDLEKSEKEDKDKSGDERRRNLRREIRELDRERDSLNATRRSIEGYSY
jgi:hypothetical protein